MRGQQAILLVQEMNIPGGTHKQVQRLADYLHRNGTQTTIHTFFHDPARCHSGAQDLNIQPVFQSKGRAANRVIFRLQRAYANIVIFIRTFRGSCPIQIHDDGFLLLMVLYRALRPRRALFWQINDMPACFHVGAAKSAKRRAFDSTFCAITRWTAQRLQGVTVNVRKNARLCREQLGVEASVFHCGVDLKEQDPHGRTPPSSDEPLRLSSVGHMLRYRNYEKVIEVADLIQSESGHPVRLDIIGSAQMDPAYASAVATEAQKAKCDVRIHGEADEQTLVRHLRDSHFFLFLNIDQSWGLAVFEAMNLGVPAVVSESVGAVELLSNNETALIVNPCDGPSIARRILDVLSQRERYYDLACRAANATKSMSWDRLYSQHIASMFAQKTAATQRLNE